MKTLPKLYLLIILLFVLHPSFSQSSIVLKGIILNESTGEKLGYASIYCQKAGIGTISNENGEFRFNIPAFSIDEAVYISFIGFEKKIIPRNKIISDSVYTILMKPISVKLHEITVIAKSKDFNEKRIIREAIRKIPVNYPIELFALNGYYRDYIRDGSYYCNLIEAAITIQDKGFNTSDYEQTQFQINQIRNNTIFRFDTIESQLLYGKNKRVPFAFINDFNGNEFWILRVHDPLRNYKQFSFSFIDNMKKQFVTNHKFKLDSIIYNGSEAFYSISIKNTRTIYENKNKAVFEITGRILINKKTLGIYGLSYSSSCISKAYTGLLYDIKLEYKEYNSKLYLNYILFKNYFEYHGPNKFSIHDILVDKEKSLVNVRFTQPIHPRLWKNAQHELKIDGKIIPADSCILAYDRIIFYCTSAKNQIANISEENSERLTVDFKNLMSIFKLPLSINKAVGLFQYREFFANEINTSNVKLIPINEAASKRIPLYQLNSKQNEEFWNTYNYFLRQPLKD